MKKQILSEEIKRMQHLAGILSENEAFSTKDLYNHDFYKKNKFNDQELEYSVDEQNVELFNKIQDELLTINWLNNGVEVDGLQRLGDEFYSKFGQDMDINEIAQKVKLELEPKIRNYGASIVVNPTGSPFGDNDAIIINISKKGDDGKVSYIKLRMLE